MKTQTTFRLTKLALVLGVATLGFNANAVYNLYKKDGLTLDINGQVDVQATKQDRALTVLQDVRHYFVSPEDNELYYSRHLAGSQLNATDKKTRLNQNHGVSFIDIRAAQVLPKDWRLTGNVGVGYSDANSMYLSNSSLSLDKKNIGAITLGRQYLHTNYVNRTGTDTPLDIFSSSALRLDYYAPKGFHASTYYSFTGMNDVRTTSNTELKSGYGASLSYRVPFEGNQSVRFGAGYTESKFNPVLTGTHWTSNTLNQYPEQVRGMAGSLEYQAGRLLLAADFGQKKETMVNSTLTPIDTKKTDYLGAKIAFDINPVWQISTGYGVKKASTTLKAGSVPLSADALALNAVGGLRSYVGIRQQYLFDKADSKEMYFQTDYRIRPNVRLYGRYDTEKTTYKVGGKDLSQEKDNNIRAGIVFTF